MKPKIIALIVAAGRGTRFGSITPKQYHLLNKKSILLHTIEKFLFHPDIDHVQVVIHPDDVDYYSEATKNINILPPTFGGNERAESVYAGLQAIQKYNPDYVLIHDALRPLVSKTLIDDIIKYFSNYACIVPVIPIFDTVKKINRDLIETTVDRENLKLAQTPQGCQYNKILDLYSRRGKETLTDDASFFEKANIPVKTIQGNINNFKITTQDDLIRAHMITNLEYETRTGIGYDVHKFNHEEGENYIFLGGHKIPHTYAMIAHSDGDVLIHAIVDALLGALGMGDIGIHFPPTDSKWMDANSEIFLQATKKFIEERNGKIINIDATIICEAPKISPYKAEIEANLANVLDIDKSRINIKATTTEKLGFTGRSEGIAVQAIANISLPSL